MKEHIDKALKMMIEEIDSNRDHLLGLNKKDVESCDRSDLSLYDRLFIDDKKIDGMIASLQKVIAKEFPFDKTLYKFNWYYPNCLRIQARRDS